MELNHTCCRFVHGQVLPRVGQCYQEKLRNTTEYVANKKQLEEYMAEFDQYYGTHRGPIELLPFDVLEKVGLGEIFSE